MLATTCRTRAQFPLIGTVRAGIVKIIVEVNTSSVERVRTRRDYCKTELEVSKRMNHLLVTCFNTAVSSSMKLQI